MAHVCRVSKPTQTHPPKKTQKHSHHQKNNKKTTTTNPTSKRMTRAGQGNRHRDATFKPIRTGGEKPFSPPITRKTKTHALAVR